MSATPDELFPHNWENKPQRDRSLVDDLFNVLCATVVGWEGILGADLAQAPEVKRVIARYHHEVTNAGETG
jgi:hypothetical protein